MKVLGQMSGTSCDGIDLCLVEFSTGITPLKYTILKTLSVPYSKTWRKYLRGILQLNVQELLELNVAWSKLLADTIVQNFKLDTYDLLSIHGHTAYHQAAKGITFQLGLLDVLATQTGKLTVGDFRNADIAKGGQGAPLVPIGDLLLYPKDVVKINIGGITNLSYQNLQGKLMAFDVAPSNLLLNQVAQDLHLEMDKDGELAKVGKLIPNLLQELNRIPFYTLAPPKSLAVEDLNIWKAILTKYPSSPDVLHTLCVHIAQQLANILPDHYHQCMVTGGGAYHTFLMEQLRLFAVNYQVELPDAVQVEFKEALIFALLGYLRVQKKLNILTTYTGASRDSIGGHLVLP